MESDLGGQASNLVAVLGKDVCENSVLALLVVSINSHLVRLFERTGGISLGRSTSLVKLISPFLSGHSRSPFFIVSQPSAFWLMSVMMPYLTCKCIVKPSPTSSLKSPVALMLSVSPLYPG